MHEEILTADQKELLTLIKSFSDNFGLVGGTAIALQIGHRRSIDFDLFSKKSFYTRQIADQIRNKYPIDRIFVDRPGEFTILVNKVKMTFYKYPFDVKFLMKFKNIIKLPDLLTLASMKSFALGRRVKWKDYVDLYFIFKKYSLRDVSENAKRLFGGEFNEKLFREQLCYFKDIDYTEEIDYLDGFEVDNDIIKKALQEISLQKL